GEDAVVDRPDGAEGTIDRAVRPGAHRPTAGEHTVVWWDPRALALDAIEDAGVRNQWILAAEHGAQAAAEGGRPHEAWIARRRPALEQGGARSRRVRTATSLGHETIASDAGPAAKDAKDDAGDVEIVATPIDRASRPRGKRFGALVHATLAVIDLASA